MSGFGRIFSPTADAIVLEIHKVFLRPLTLLCEKIFSPKLQSTSKRDIFDTRQEKMPW